MKLTGQVYQNMYTNTVASVLCIKVAKLSYPKKVPLSSLPVGKPWKMVVVDVLQVPIFTSQQSLSLCHPGLLYQVSGGNTNYAMPDQTAVCITNEIVR